MKLERLIKMANNIGDFFNSESNKELAADGVKNHLLRTWDPRMRKEIITYCMEDGSELSNLVKAAVTKLAAN
jgi:formate dehydrogenase subunit delta